MLNQAKELTMDITRTGATKNQTRPLEKDNQQLEKKIKQKISAAVSVIRTNVISTDIRDSKWFSRLLYVYREQTYFIYECFYSQISNMDSRG